MNPSRNHPSGDKGQRALTIDEIPLDWCFSDGVVLDFRHKADGQRITVDDVQKELERIGYCHMEKMANLAAIGQPHGFTVCCFPIKIKGASAGWARPVAILQDN